MLFPSFTSAVIANSLVYSFKGAASAEAALADNVYIVHRDGLGWDGMQRRENAKAE